MPFTLDWHSRGTTIIILRSDLTFVDHVFGIVVAAEMSYRLKDANPNITPLERIFNVHLAGEQAGTKGERRQGLNRAHTERCETLELIVSPKGYDRVIRRCDDRLRHSHNFKRVDHAAQFKEGQAMRVLTRVVEKKRILF